MAVQQTTGPVARVRARRYSSPSDVAATAVVGALLVEFILLAIWQRNGYWDFSDGVYAASSEQLLHGLAPYRDFAAAQPPPVYLFGALLLSVHDGLASLRAGLALLDFTTAALVGICTWRVTGRRGPALIAAVAAPLLPITLHEHAQLTPETLAAPLLLAGALGCARPGRGATGGGLLLALAAACKLAFVIPALAIALASPARRRASAALTSAAAALAIASLVVFGTQVWRQTVTAQLQVGGASLHYVAGLAAQAAWNELPLIPAAAFALSLARKHAEEGRDRPFVHTLAAAAAGGLTLALTLFKRGSYVNVLAVAEPPLLVLATAGLAWAWQRSGRERYLVAALVTLIATQSISLLASPADPWAATRPFARSGLTWSASPAQVDTAVSKALRCPTTRAYSGAPYIAFLADRRMPGNQPDLFMLEYAHEEASFARRATRDQPRCPPT
jgi:hypothetical protein